MSEIVELYDAALKFLKANDPESAWGCIAGLYVQSVEKGSREEGYKVVKGFRKNLKQYIERGERVEIG